MSRSDRNAERGSALVLAIFVMVLLSGMGISLLFLTQTELQLNQSELRFRKAFYVAEAGLEDARFALYEANANNPLSDDLVAVAGINSVVEGLPAGLSVTYNGASAPTISGYGDDTPFVALTEYTYGDETGWYMVFLNNDPIDAEKSPVDSNDRVMLTSIGVTSGNATEIVRAIVEPNPPVISPPPAALTLLGPSPTFDDGDEAGHMFSGDDCISGGGQIGLRVPTVGVIGTDAATAVRSSLGTNKYISGGHEASDTIGDLTDDSEATVDYPIDPEWLECRELQNMLEDFRNHADVVCTSHTCTEPSPSMDRVIFADTDYTPSDGQGLIVITGTATLAADLDWTGMIMAVGEGSVIRRPGGNGEIAGALVVANIAGPDGVYGNDDDCTGGDDGLAAASFVTEDDDSSSSGGLGSGLLTYCARNIEDSTPPGPYAVVGFLQR
ncbi:MAG: hypothetical protein GY716_15050 [bacterium]|nr:hypothetical protein [bacterium]